MLFSHARLRALAGASLALPTLCLADTAGVSTLSASVSATASTEIAAADSIEPETIEVIGARVDHQQAPIAQTTSTVSREQFATMPSVSIGEVLALVPGVTFVQGNGPRDVSISVRGSNARQTFGIRNLQVFEDGFPVTQPDGLARTDLTDPHAYGSIEVMRGPSSARYGNYATGGAIDFRTRSGRDLQGVEGGIDLGSYGYSNEYLTAGGGDDRFEYSAFASHVRGDDPATEHTRYRTTTLNLLTSWQATSADRLTFKFIHNDLDTDLSLRLSRNQYELNPYQRGCADQSAAGCATLSVFANGFSGTRVPLSPEQAGIGRDDRRTIVGARWEHAFDSSTDLRTQLVFDNRDIRQPTGNTSFNGTYPSFNLTSDLTHRGEWFGLPSKTLLGLYANHEDLNYNVYNLTPEGHASLGGQTQNLGGEHLNAGARIREELVLSERWTAVTGIGAEYTHLQAQLRNYGYSTTPPTISRIDADREFVNVAPELGLRFAASEQWTLHARAAAAYGTPQVGNLFVTPDGVAGNNTELKAQRNIGFDLGAEWNVARQLQASFTGFYEFFRNELVTQSAGANLQSYTFNAPRSEHRGIEAALDWHLLPNALPGAHVSLSYLLDDQIYKRYTERLSAGSQSATFERDGNDLPGVTPQTLNARLIYDQTTGVLAGLGGFIELSWRDDTTLDNANLLDASGYSLVNLNLHYAAPQGHGFWSRLSAYAAVQNLLDKTYIASASNVSNTLNADSGAQNGRDALLTSTGSIYAGAPRSVFAGLRLKF